MKSIEIPCECGRKHILRKQGTKVKHTVDESGIEKEKPVKKEKGFLEILFGSDDENEEEEDND